MDKDKSSGHGGGLPPPSGRYSGFSPSGNSFNVKSEPSSSASFPPLAPGATSDLGHFGHGMSTDSGRFSHDLSRMPDNPPRNLGHRRAHSEILTLPDDISFDSDLGVVGGADGPSFSDETEEDLLSMYLDMDKFNSSSATSAFQVGEASSQGAPSTLAGAPVSGAAENVAIGSNERPRVRHQHSQSMDGSTTIKPEMLVSGSEDLSAADSKKAMSAAKLAELALIDPKRAKRIWANRQSAARSKERKMRYIAELERKVQTLQTEATSLSAQLTLLQRDTNGLTAENSELKLRLQTMEQQVHLQDALNDALKEEIQHLKVLTGQSMANGGPMMNYASFGGGGQQFYPNNHVHTLLTAQQFQQLQIHSQKHQHPFQQHQLHQLQQQQMQQQQEQQPQQQSGDLKIRGTMPSPSQKDNNASDANSSASKDC
ncbi:probable transcription factor PosF21 [Ziziphus jujuba]|uniref:Probable transcription factor PosF21 n=1 Tax=Ziziphus jujuba TaxID=326968 RepID=A0A6P3YU37_ZIZJJ|nr:probable transcription factor PosF21 [Ziziphus jujuba var. spinosa]XP_015867591.1 probable transcription factor PosF21 [Ziziphus jujuba]XP_015867592.1 probable transcription factor PosF21 [Ziziphus jujuba]